jgi:hypothetical protein
MTNEGIYSLSEGIYDKMNCWNDYFIRMENERTPKRMTPCKTTGKKCLFRVKRVSHADGTGLWPITND